MLERIKNNTSGFTLAELLVVVAIMMVLSSIAFIGGSAIFRNLSYAQYCDHAKDIYAAAQNNISDMSASGEWDESGNYDSSASGTSVPWMYTGDASLDASMGNLIDSKHCWVTATYARETGLMPAGSIDGKVWKESYIIEYDYESGAVYGVFYTENDENCDALHSYYLQDGVGIPGASSYREEASLKNNNPIIGYFGGPDASGLTTAELETPSVVVEPGKFTVTDRNKTSENDALRALNTFQVLTISNVSDAAENADEAPESIRVVMQFDDPSSSDPKPVITLYRAMYEADNVYDARNERPVYKLVGDSPLSAEDADRLCKIVASSTEDGQGTPDSYEFNIAAVEAAFNSMGDGEPLGFNATQLLTFEDRCSCNEVICISKYAYALGYWQALEDIIFTTNIHADWNSEDHATTKVDAGESVPQKGHAELNLYVDENKNINNGGDFALQGDENNKQTMNQDEFWVDVRDFYDQNTASEDLLFYSVAISDNGCTLTNRSAFSDKNGKVTDRYHRFAHDANAAAADQRATDTLVFKLSDDLRNTQGETKFTITLTAYPPQENDDAAPDMSKQKVLTIDVLLHANDAANYYYVVDKSGNYAAELYLLSGHGFTPTIHWNTNVLAIDSTNIELNKTTDINPGAASFTNALAAQNSSKVYLLKKNPNADYSKGKTEVGQGAGSDVWVSQ